MDNPDVKGQLDFGGAKYGLCMPVLSFVYIFHLKTRQGCFTNDTLISTQAVRVHWISHHVR